jgi:chromosome partitioning protein
MAIVITIANQKGGVGKTAISVNLAAGLARAQHRVLVVDADPQGNSFRWFARRLDTAPAPYPILGGAHHDINRYIPDISAQGAYDFIVIDCPAGQSRITRSALLAADRVLIPVMPSLCDFDAAETFLPLLSEVADLRPKLTLHVLISRKLAGRSRESLEAREAAHEFFCRGPLAVSLLDTEIYERRAEIVRAYTESITVFERKHSAAATEFAALTQEIINLA